MVSSKFSRPVPVQQPPPICKKGVPIVGANLPLHQQTVTVAFNVDITKGGAPPHNKVDGAMLNLGENIGTSQLMHWETSPFNDPDLFSWRADLKINAISGFTRAVFWWVEIGPTSFQFAADGYPPLDLKIWQWRPRVVPSFGQTSFGQILFATTNK